MLFYAKNIAEKKAARSRHLYGGPSLPIKKKNKNENKRKIKKKIKKYWKNEKKYYWGKKPTKLSWPINAKSDT